MPGIWRRKAVACACDALPLEARPEHDAVDLLRHLSATVRRFTPPSEEASPDGDCEEMLIVESNFKYGGRSERCFSRGQRKLFGVEFGAFDIVAGEHRDYFVIDANSTSGMGHAVEDRMEFLHEPGEPNAR